MTHRGEGGDVSTPGNRYCERIGLLVVPGEPYLHEILQRAKDAGALVDLVVSAPGWAEPWSRARRGAILEIEPWRVTVRLDGEVWRLDLRDIQAVRVLYYKQPDGT
jgi:hypothetical protein